MVRFNILSLYINVYAFKIIRDNFIYHKICKTHVYYNMKSSFIWNSEKKITDKIQAPILIQFYKIYFSLKIYYYYPIEQNYCTTRPTKFIFNISKVAIVSFSYNRGKLCIDLKSTRKKKTNDCYRSSSTRSKNIAKKNDNIFIVYMQVYNYQSEYNNIISRPNHNELC